MRNETVSQEFSRFAEWCDGKSDLYKKYCDIVVEDGELRDFIGSIEADNRPYVFFAAVHYILLEGTDNDLASLYPHIDGESRIERIKVDYLFKDFILDNSNSIRKITENRKVQTNEVRRCSALIPGFCHINKKLGEPVSIVEIGSSAGLNLLWDNYSYYYSSERQLGSNSRLTLECDLRNGDLSFQTGLPKVKERIGLDINPLDVTNAEDRRWLKALTWPEHSERRERLEKALDIAQNNPPYIMEGDVVEDLENAVSRVSDPVIIYGTQVLWSLTPEKIDEFLETVQKIQETRDIYLLFGERGGLKWLQSDRQTENGSPEVWLEFSKGSSDDFERLGTYEVHGEWLKWD